MHVGGIILRCSLIHDERILVCRHLTLINVVVKVTILV